MNECEDYNTTAFISHTVPSWETHQQAARVMIESWKKFNPNYGDLSVFLCENHLFSVIFIRNTFMRGEPSKCPRCAVLSRTRIAP